MVIIFTVRWVVVLVLDDEFTIVFLPLFFSVVIGNMIKGRPGGLMYSCVSSDTLVAWHPDMVILKTWALQGTGRFAGHTHRASPSMVRCAGPDSFLVIGENLVVLKENLHGFRKLNSRKLQSAQPISLKDAAERRNFMGSPPCLKVSKLLS